MSLTGSVDRLKHRLTTKSKITIRSAWIQTLACKNSSKPRLRSQHTTTEPSRGCSLGVPQNYGSVELFAYDASSNQTVAVPWFKCRHCQFKQRLWCRCINVGTIAKARSNSGTAIGTMVPTFKCYFNRGSNSGTIVPSFISQQCHNQSITRSSESFSGQRCSIICIGFYAPQKYFFPLINFICRLLNCFPIHGQWASSAARCSTTCKVFQESALSLILLHSALKGKFRKFRMDHCIKIIIILISSNRWL